MSNSINSLFRAIS